MVVQRLLVALRLGSYRGGMDLVARSIGPLQLWQAECMACKLVQCGRSHACMRVVPACLVVECCRTGCAMTMHAEICQMSEHPAGGLTWGRSLSEKW